jgi:hypothetical protein
MADSWGERKLPNDMKIISCKHTPIQFEDMYIHSMFYVKKDIALKLNGKYVF